MKSQENKNPSQTRQQATLVMRNLLSVCFAIIVLTFLMLFTQGCSEVSSEQIQQQEFIEAPAPEFSMQALRQE